MLKALHHLYMCTHLSIINPKPQKGFRLWDVSHYSAATCIDSMHVQAPRPPWATMSSIPYMCAHTSTRLFFRTMACVLLCGDRGLQWQPWQGFIWRCCVGRKTGGAVRGVIDSCCAAAVFATPQPLLPADIPTCLLLCYGCAF